VRTKLLRAAAVVLAAGAGFALPAAPTATAAAADLPAPTRTTPVTGTGVGDPSSTDPPTLVGVRVGLHPRYDRTVFDFTGGTPSYRVEYGALIEQGRGTVVPVAGAVTLRVVLMGAFTYDIDTGASTIDLNQVRDPRFPTLRQVRFGGAFEGHVSAGLGLLDRVGFRAFQLQNPPRVVVDVAHQPTQPFDDERVWVGVPTVDTVSISAVRAGRHPGYDRLVFDLRTADIPLVSVAYTRTAPSTIHVGFTGRTTAPAVVSPPHTVYIGLTQLRSVSFAVYENGTVSAWVSTRHRNGFRVMVLRQPTRIVLDVAHVA